MEIRCPECMKKISSQQINIQTNMAQCIDCDCIFSFADKISSDIKNSENLINKPKVNELPKGIKIEKFGPDLNIKRSWFSLGTIFLIFFCIFWNAFLIVWYTIAFTQDSPLMMKLFPIIHVVVGIVVLYVTLAKIFNTTTVKANSMQLSIKHFPIPWPGNRTIEPKNIKQLYVKKEIFHGKHGHMHYKYNLMALLSDRKKIKLISGLKTPDQALYIEQKIESHLNIKDEFLEDEMKY